MDNKNLNPQFNVFDYFDINNLKTTTKATNISEKGIEYLKKKEGFVPHKYPDINGYAIGYGTHLPEDSIYLKQNQIDEETATKLLIDHIDKNVLPIIQKHVKIDLNQNQFDAIVSLIYNIGSTRFIKSSALKDLNNKNWESMKKNWSAFRLAGGKVNKHLEERRQEELNIFFS